MEYHLIKILLCAVFAWLVAAQVAGCGVHSKIGDTTIGTTGFLHEVNIGKAKLKKGVK